MITVILTVHLVTRIFHRMFYGIPTYVRNYKYVYVKKEKKITQEMQEIIIDYNVGKYTVNFSDQMIAYCTLLSNNI